MHERRYDRRLEKGKFGLVMSHRTSGPGVRKFQQVGGFFFDGVHEFWVFERRDKRGRKHERTIRRDEGATRRAATIRGRPGRRTTRNGSSPSLIKQIWGRNKRSELGKRKRLSIEMIPAERRQHTPLRRFEGNQIGFPKSRALRSAPGELVDEPPLAENSRSPWSPLERAADRLTRGDKMRRRVRPPNRAQRILPEMRPPGDGTDPALLRAPRTKIIPRKLETKNDENPGD